MAPTFCLYAEEVESDDGADAWLASVTDTMNDDESNNRNRNSGNVVVTAVDDSGVGGVQSDTVESESGTESSPSETAEAILQTLIEPALASPTSVGGGTMSEAVTLPDSDNMLSLASVRHGADICAETDDDDDTCEAEIVHESIAPDQPLSAPLTSTIAAPSTTKIIKFAVPAMGVWLCGPILSMIDTSAVGLLSGTAQQAALNPAVSVTDYGGLLVAFMYTAATNLIAGAREADKNTVEDGGLGEVDVAKVDAKVGRSRTARTLLASLQLALYVGIGFGLTLGTFSRQLLRALIGDAAGMDPAVFAAANRYVQIRSLGMPAAVAVGTLQASCLGLQDIKSPLYVLLAAALVNACGDALLVGRKSIWIGGCSGAAWATVLSQYAALGLFVAWLRTKPRSSSRRSKGDGMEPAEPASIDKEEVKMVDISDAILELTTGSEEGRPRRRRFRRTVRDMLSKKDGRLSGWTERLNKKKKVDAGISNKGSRSPSSAPPSRGVLANQFRSLDLFRLPPLAVAKEFWPFVIPVTTTAIGRISGYLAMSHVASSALGVIDMAAQAVIFSFFCCLTPICDSLNLTAQSFVPAIYEKQPSRARADALRQTLRNFSKVGGLFGAVIVAMVATIPVLSQYFTADMMVRSAVNQAIPGLSLFFALSGLVCVGEGMLLGQKDLKFLGNAYGAYFFAVPYFLLRLKKRALLGLQDVGVGTMWQTFSIYQLIRCCI